MQEGEHIAKWFVKKKISCENIDALVNNLPVWHSTPVHPVAQLQIFGAEYEKISWRM
jgi:hypothetical protein